MHRKKKLNRSGFNLNVLHIFNDRSTLDIISCSKDEMKIAH